LNSFPIFSIKEGMNYYFRFPVFDCRLKRKNAAGTG